MKPGPKSTERAGLGRNRKLSLDELDLWVSIAGAAKPHKRSAQPKVTAGPKAAPKSSPEAGKNIRRYEAASYTPPVQTPAPGIRPLILAGRQFKRRIKSGRSQADAVLDLHGMRQDEAHWALKRFLVDAHAKGHQIVIIVTGKGRVGDDGTLPWEIVRGVLHQSVPHWLQDPDLRHVILGFSEAGPRHGGSGALYVRIRKRDGGG